jgi:hypothetical protein
LDYWIRWRKTAVLRRRHLGLDLLVDLHKKSLLLLFRLAKRGSEWMVYVAGGLVEFPYVVDGPAKSCITKQMVESL